jgi:hypothetical protein
MSNFLTLDQVNESFKMDILPLIAEQYEQDGIPDRPARSEAFNDYTDSLCKDGQITDEDYNDWGISDSLETTLYWN